MKIKIWQVLFLLFLIGLIIRLYIDITYFFWDEAVYLLNAKWFALGKSEYNEVDYRPPLIPFLLSFFYKLDNFENVSRVFMILLNSLSIPTIYFLGKEINPKVGLLSAIILVLLPFHIQTSRWMMTDAANMLFLMLFTLFLLKKRPILSGFFAGLSFLTKFTSVIFIPAIFMIVFYRSKESRFLFRFLIGLTIIIPYLVFNQLYYGSAFDFFFKAIEGVANKETTTPFFILWLFYDLIGIVLLPFFLYSIYTNLKNKSHQFFLFWFFSFFLRVSVNNKSGY